MKIDELRECLLWCSQEYSFDDIHQVLGVWYRVDCVTPNIEEYHWIMQLKDNRFAYLQGNHDCTGWDDNSAAWTTFADTALQAISSSSETIQGVLIQQIQEYAKA